MQFLEEQERAFPSLDGTSSAQDGFKHMLESETDGLGSEESRPIIPCNPIERKDSEIAALKKQVEDSNATKELLTKTLEELRIVRKSKNLAQAQLKHVQRATEQRFCETLHKPNFITDDAEYLSTIYATLMDPDNFQYDEKEDLITPKDTKNLMDSLMAAVDEQIPKTPLKSEKLLHIKNKVLEKVKAQTKANLSKRRSRKDSSSSSIGSRNSESSAASEGSGRGVTRPRSQDEELGDAKKISLIHEPAPKPQSKLKPPTKS